MWSFPYFPQICKVGFSSVQTSHCFPSYAIVYVGCGGLWGMCADRWRQSYFLPMILPLLTSLYYNSYVYLYYTILYENKEPLSINKRLFTQDSLCQTSWPNRSGLDECQLCFNSFAFSYFRYGIKEYLIWFSCKYFCDYNISELWP